MNKLIITGSYKGKNIKRIAFSSFQAFTIINLLAREGVSDLGMREEECGHEPGNDTDAYIESYGDGM